MFLERAVPTYTDDERRQRKEQALHLLRDEFFASVMEQAENDTIATWLRSADPVARERAWLLAKGLDLVVLTLSQIVGDAPLDHK